MTDSPHVTDVSHADFTQQVVEASHQTPVLVDFWAPWCGPCRMLTPLLERLAHDYDGKLRIAKVNTDVEQELALEFRIRGIPAVKLFRHGKMVGEFVGVQPESAIRALVDPHIPNEFDALLERAAALTDEGRLADAAALLRDALTRAPQEDRIKIELAKLLASPASEAQGDARLHEARELLDSLSLRSSTDPAVDRLRARLDLLRAVAGAPSTQDLTLALAADAGDNAARFQLGARYALAAEYEPAMEQFIDIVRRDRSFGDDAARKALVGLFNLVGNQHPLAVKYRGLLSRALN